MANGYDNINGYIRNFQSDCGCDTDTENTPPIAQDYPCPDADSFPLCYPIKTLAELQIVKAYSYDPTQCQTVSFDDIPEYTYDNPYCIGIEPFGLPCGTTMPQINNLDACTP